MRPIRKLATVTVFVVAFSIVALMLLLLAIAVEGLVILDRPLLRAASSSRGSLSRHRKPAGARAIRRRLRPPSGRTRCTRLHIKRAELAPRPFRPGRKTRLAFLHHVARFLPASISRPRQTPKYRFLSPSFFGNVKFARYRYIRNSRANSLSQGRGGSQTRRWT